MTILYMRVSDVNEWARGLEPAAFSELTGLPRGSRGEYDYSRHFLKLETETVLNLDLKFGFSSEGPCRRPDGSEDDSYCSFDPGIPKNRYPRSRETHRALAVIAFYVTRGGAIYASADDAIRGKDRKGPKRASNPHDATGELLRDAIGMLQLIREGRGIDDTEQTQGKTYRGLIDEVIMVLLELSAYK